MNATADFGVEQPADLGKHDLWPGYLGHINLFDAAYSVSSYGDAFYLGGDVYAEVKAAVLRSDEVSAWFGYGEVQSGVQPRRRYG